MSTHALDDDCINAVDHVGNFISESDSRVTTDNQRQPLSPLNTISQYLISLTALRSEAQRTRQRRLVVLSGEQSWARLLINTFCQQVECNNVLWVASDAPQDCEVINNTQARHLLGCEIDSLIYDAYCGFDPNAIAAVSGAVNGGGLFVLIIPPLEQWTQCVDPDYQRILVYPYELHQLSQRFISLIKHSLLRDASCLIIEQNKPVRLSGDERCAITASTNTAFQADMQALTHCCRTKEQESAVKAIIKVCTGHRRRPLVMTSDRGRGKSSAMGIASAQLLQQGKRSIIVTAPRSHSVQPVFEHAAKMLNVVLDKTNTLCYQQSSITFIAPDQLLRQHLDTDLLLVDEAAAIPAAMLEQMLHRYSRIVFSTTVHGYEGTGRGFAIRFKHCLDTICAQWKSVQLSEPIRWAQGDPVERWLFDALLLEPQPLSNINAATIELSQCTVEKLDRDRLLYDRSTLEQLFALLVNAHYQTSPSDLRNLLDGPNITIWITRCQGWVVGAALVAEEGGFDETLSAAVCKGQRRPQGHLLPQTLAVHCGWQDAPGLSYRRIMRIAIEPDLQRLGLGKQLLQAIIKQARLQSIDMVGSSFAATADVMAFWRKAHCVPVRVGIAKDASSGVPSSVVLCALSTSAQQLLVQAHQRFVAQFCYGLNSIYRDLSPALVIQLLSGSVSKQDSNACLDQQDWLDINAFANGYRQYEVCGLALNKFVCVLLGCVEISEITTQWHRELLVKIILQHHEIKGVADSLKLTGKKQLITALRETVKDLVRYFLLAGYC